MQVDTGEPIPLAQLLSAATPADVGGVAVELSFGRVDEDELISQRIVTDSQQRHIASHSMPNANNGHRLVVGAAGRVNGMARSPGQAYSSGWTPGGGIPAGGGASVFRNRVSELEQVVDGLTSPDGEHFWFVIAPPQLGKTWFLNEVQRILSTQVPGTWMLRRIDLRTQPNEVVHDALSLIRTMFAGRASGDNAAQPREIAAGVLANGERQLYMLDSAELLGAETIRELRSYLAQICQQVQAARSSRVRLALIVASRRDAEWLGISPKPRLRRLPLSEFRVDVVYEALGQMAKRLGSRFTSAELEAQAEFVHRLSEGLPALLMRYLDWIEAERWTDVRRLEDHERFSQLARPYVEDILLSPSSLLGQGAERTDERLPAIEQALKALALYRLFTQSHLRHHALDGALKAALDSLGWSIEQIWAAVSSTDLLYRPQGEPWHQIHAPIRRLLGRYWYPAPALRAQAHATAGRFVRSFAAEWLGRDQAVVLVECLWHLAQAASAGTPPEPSEEIIELARTMSIGLIGTDAFTQNDLRVCAKELLETDEELADALRGSDRLLDELIDVIMRP